MADFHPLPPPKDLHPSSTSDSSSASDCEDDPPIPESVEDKLRYVFTSISKGWFSNFSLIQFWAPVDLDGRRLLTTSDQLFFLGDESFEEYRLCCVKHKYNIDVNKVDVEDEENPTIICTGAQATAFLNHIPELVRHPTDHQMTPLESSAFQCGLMHSVVLPVFYPSQSCCVGVVEYSTSNLDELLLDFNFLNVQLEIGGGLKTFNARERLPYKTICGLQNAKDEIDEALKIILHAHCLPFAQVWIPYEDENQVAFSSSLQDTRTKRMLWLKLTGHNHHSFYKRDSKRLEDYGNACHWLPLKMDKDFTGKTLENYEPHFVDDIWELNDSTPQRLCHINFSCSCFVICLRSTKTRNLDYVFEFLWSRDKRHNVILLESLLLTLERCLPSFKIASGAQVGDELSIVDVQDSTESERKYFKIFQRNQLSPVSVTPKRGTQSKVEKSKGKTEEIQISREEIESEFGKTQKEAAENLKISVTTLKRKCAGHHIYGWRGPKYMKRKVKQSHKSQSDTNEEEDNGGAIQEASANIRETSLVENILTIKVKYVDHDTFKFDLPVSSAKFEDIEKEINERFKLNPSDYKIKYRDEDGDWILLSSDKDMRVCIRDHRNLNTTPIEMEVLLRQI